jgi:hypothetical protein
MARSPCIVAGTGKIMARQIMHRRITGQLSLTLLLALVTAFSDVGSAQDGQKGAPPQEPPKGQGPSPKSGGQGGGGVSTGVGVDVGQVIGLFRHHAKAHLQVNTQQVPAGQPVLFTATVAPNAPGLTYEFHWTKDKDAPAQREITPAISHAYPSPGQYIANVVVYSNGKKVATSNDVSIVVQQAAEGAPATAPATTEIVWRLSIQPNQVKSVAIAASNNCNQPQRWEVASQPFPAFMHLSGDSSFDVNAHSRRELPVQFDSSGLKEGEHEGTVIVRCVTCKPTECKSDAKVLKVHLTVEPAVVASVQPSGANGIPTPTPLSKTTEPAKTATTLPQVTPPALVPPSPAGRYTTPAPTGSNGTPSTGKSDSPQQQTAKGTSTQASSNLPSQSVPAGVSTQPAKSDDPGKTGAPGITAASPDQSQSGAPLLSYSVSLQADSRIEAGKPTSFSAELYPNPPSGEPVRYCFLWGDGSPQNCQDSPAATHVYRSRGKYLASVEVLADQEKLAAAIQIEAALPMWLKILLVLALVLALLAAAYGTHKARKVVKGAVSVKADFGSHKITPAAIESGEGLHIRCVRTAAVSTITFSSSDQLTQENKETANV